MTRLILLAPETTPLLPYYYLPRRRNYTFPTLLLPYTTSTHHHSDTPILPYYQRISTLLLPNPTSANTNPQNMVLITAIFTQCNGHSRRHSTMWPRPRGGRRSPEVNHSFHSEGDLPASARSNYLDPLFYFPNKLWRWTSFWVCIWNIFTEKNTFPFLWDGIYLYVTYTRSQRRFFSASC